MRFPSYLTSVKISLLAGTLYIGSLMVVELMDRRAQILGLERYAIAHPEHASVVAALIECQKKLLIDSGMCTAGLIEHFGTDVIKSLGEMASGGAFAPVDW